MGDVAGIGPEVIAEVLCEQSTYDRYRPVVFGHPAVLERALHQRGEIREFPIVTAAAELKSASAESRFICWNCGPAEADDVPPGGIDARAGQAAHDYLVTAIDAALAGDIDGIVTAPLNKAALHAAGINFPGHTEILADRCGVTDFAMMLYLPPGANVKGSHGLGVAHVTLHTSIKSVPGLLSTDRIREKIRLMNSFLHQIGHPSPRIGVAALNPHAGEAGLFGDEETQLIAPAVRAEQAAGISVAGPIPADALLRLAAAGEYDGVVAMYHDQGHIALKLLGCDRAVNITLGLPIVRTSPSHGTAFDIAWQGKADATGFRNAADIACRLIAGGVARPGPT
jgi:4-hydroxythreonine-4-phosphate dehydrogenase